MTGRPKNFSSLLVERKKLCPDKIPLLGCRKSFKARVSLGIRLLQYRSRLSKWICRYGVFDPPGTGMNPAFLGAYLITILNESQSEASYGSYHPRNWPARRKAWIISILVFLEFFVTIIATTGSAAVHYALSDFPDDSKKALMASFVSTYSFGQAVGSILIPQFTEPFGRRQFYLWSTGAFSVTCVITGVTPSIVGVAFGRFLGGLASAVPAVVVAGSVEDLFNEQSRIWLIWLWNCLTVAGQVLGPVYSTFIAARLGWYVELRSFLCYG